MFVPLTPLRFLERAADLFGARVGVVCGERAFTYAELCDRAWRLGVGLRERGIQPGDRVAYLSFTHHALFEGYYGVPAAGAVLLPLNVRLGLEELARIVNHAEPRMLIFEPEFGETISRLRDKCASVEQWVEIGAGPGDNVRYEELLAETAAPPDLAAINEMAPAQLFYTSGSTGSPKGVVLSQRTLYLHAQDYALTYKQPETMVDLVTIPLYHAGGWGRPYASALFGIKQVLARRFEPPAVLNLLARHRVTDLCLVPVMAQMLLDEMASCSYDVSSVRQVHIGGAANSLELARRLEDAFPNAECSSGYGLTETAPVVSQSEPRSSILMRDPSISREDRLARQAKIGRPVPGVAVRVVDEAMRDVARDGVSVGEVVVAGDHVMDGYYRDPESTREAIQNGWLRTGDLATWDADGYLSIVDRKKQIIVSGGENISSLEVEQALAAHPLVAECAVVAAPDQRWGEVPAAVIVPVPGAGPDELSVKALAEFLDGKLARYKRPRHVVLQSEPLPKTGTGKIDKRVLRERFWTQANPVRR